MKTINQSLITKLLDDAENSPRKRAHYNLHSKLDDPIQRLCVTAKFGTYIRPHKHMEDKWEMFVILKGSADFLTFDDNGIVTDRIELSIDNGSIVIEIPPKTVHTMVITSKEAVLMEIKPGPYIPHSSGNAIPWSPEENTQEAIACENFLQKVKVGKNASLWKDFDRNK